MSEELSKQLDRDTIDQLLKYGAYHLFLEQNINEEKEKDKMLLEEGIDSILERSATITYSQSDREPDKLSGFSFAR